jgi:hypothetical protein
MLFQADEQILHVYFPMGGVVSLVVSLSTGEMIEAAMVGSWRNGTRYSRGSEMQ